MTKHNSYVEFVDKVRKVNESLFDDCIEIILKNENDKEEVSVYFDIWRRMNLYNIYNDNLSVQIFDCGVNCGPETAIKMIQKLVAVDLTGAMDCETAIAINDSQLDLLDMYRQERKKYYYNQARNDLSKVCYLKAWMDRIDKTKFA